MTDAGDTYQYAYNGLGQRVQQTVDSVVTNYLLDTQPALPRILAATTDAATTRYQPRPPHSLGLRKKSAPSTSSGYHATIEP